jgi:hypothetical protein
VLTCADYIGYVVEFPGAESDDIPVTTALNNLNITSPRSAKRKANHFYSPYSPSKRRGRSAMATMRKVSFSQAETVPLRRATSLEAATNADVETVVVPQERQEEQPKPWGTLVSRTQGKPDIELRRSTTGIGHIFHYVDVETGERQILTCNFLFKRWLTVTQIAAFSKRKRVISAYGQSSR